MFADAGTEELLPAIPAILLMDEDEETVDRELDEGLCWRGVVDKDDGPATAEDVDATGALDCFRKIMSPCLRPTSAKCWDRLEVNWKGKRLVTWIDQQVVDWYRSPHLYCCAP